MRRNPRPREAPFHYTFPRAEWGNMTERPDNNLISVRPISPDDAEAAAELSGQLGYKASTETMRSRIEKLHCNGKSQAAFVACLGGVVVAWIEIAIVQHLQSEPHTVVGGLVVRDDARSRGIGSRLLAEAEEWSRKQGILVVRVRSQAARQDAHRFYLREGHRQVKTSAVFEKTV
jgi:GNAT superfamily N-acetyltransferase